MKYTREHTGKDGKKTWAFVPPVDVRLAGVCKYTVFFDGRTARYEIPRLIHLVEEYRKGNIKEGRLSESSLFVHLRNHYLNSEYYGQLSNLTQKAYESTLKTISETVVKGRPFGSYRLKDIDTKLCRSLYKQIADNTSIQSANTKYSVLSVVLNHGVNLELFTFNPMSRVKKLKNSTETQIWTQKQIEEFLDAGYEEFDTRNITLLFHMCYEWAQKPGDISGLTWGMFDWTDNTVTIGPTNRGTTVYLPVEEPLLSLLKQQQEDWSFQDYVVPHTIPSGTVYKPMSKGQVSGMYRKVRDKTTLPSELKLNAVRATAITEMVEAGVDITSIKQVSGHKSLQSLSPYVKNTKRGAARALLQRRNT